MQDLLEKAARVRLAVFDIDGVLTDGSLYLADSGEEHKAFNIQDGLGLKMLKASGVGLAIISGRNSRAVEMRAHSLGIDRLYQGIDDKLAAFDDLLLRANLPAAAVSYMGDDLPDLPVLRRCGLPLAVPDAPQLVKDRACYVTRSAGGRGAVREVCELIMRAQGTFEARLATYDR